LLVAVGILWYFGIFARKPKMVLVTSDIPYWDLVIDGADQAARLYDVNLTVVRTKADESSQTQALKDLLKDKYVGVAVSPLNPRTQAGVLADLAANTTLVTMDSDSPVSRRLCFVGTDNYDAGRRCGQCVRSAIPKGGDVVICMVSFDKDNAVRRRQGVIDELLNRPFETHRVPDPSDQPIAGKEYTISTTLVDNADPQVATDQAVAALKANPNIKCFVGLMSYSTPAILAALEQSHKLDQVRVVGFDANTKTLDGIEAGHVDASILQDQYGCGFQAIRILAEDARGDHSSLPMFETRTLPVDVITKANVASIRTQLANERHPSNDAGT
jgi:ribose transport system substrate-binding protein